MITFQNKHLLEDQVIELEKAREKKKNKKRNRYIYRASILLVMVAAIAYALITNLSGEKDTNYEVGDKAPNFELTQVNHNNEAETIKLSEFEGKEIGRAHV